MRVQCPFADGQLLGNRHCFPTVWCGVCVLGCIPLFGTPGIVVQALCMEFSGQEHWSRFPHFLLQGVFPAPGSNPLLLHPLRGQADSPPLVPPANQLGACFLQGLCLAERGERLPVLTCSSFYACLRSDLLCQGHQSHRPTSLTGLPW